MFKTMDGVEVYDKHEVDAIVTPIQQAATSAKQTAESIDSRKLNKSDATREFATDRERLSALEEGKADKSAIPSLVTEAIDSVINSKLATLESDINHIVDDSIDDELEDYDTSAQVTNKINTALQNHDTSSQVTNKIDTALQNYDTSGEVTDKITTALQSYDDSATVNSKIATAINNIPAGPTAMTPAEATAMINQYF